MPLSHEFITGTAILDRREIDLADAHEPPKELTVGAQNLLAGGYCAMTVMPMMRGDETIGALNVIRRHRGPLSDKQRELLRTFANQAVIAIENTRLFNELRESLSNRRRRQTCLRSSAARPSICKRFLTLLLNQQHGFAKPIWRRLIGKKTMLIGRSHRMGIRQNCRPIWRAIQFRQGTARLSAVLSGKVEPFTFTMFWLIRTTI